MRAWGPGGVQVALFIGAMLADPAVVFASEAAGAGPVLVAPLQGSESLRASHAAEVGESLVRALSSKGLAVAEADVVLGHALVACQSRACVEKALTAAGAEASVVPALWTREEGGQELTLTLVRAEGRNLNVSRIVGEELAPAVVGLVDSLLAAEAGRGGAGTEPPPGGRRPNAWMAGPAVLVAGGTAAFVAIGAGAATKSEQQQLNTTAVAVWSAVGAAALAGGVAWWVVGAKRRRGLEMAVGPAKIDLRLRF